METSTDGAYPSLENFFIGGVSFHEKKKIGKNYCAWDEKIGSDYRQWVCTHRPEISSLRNGYFCHTGFGFCYGEANKKHGP